MASDQQQDGDGDVELIIRNPARGSDYRLRCGAADTTVGALKERLQAEYPGEPQPDAQTVRRAPERWGHRQRRSGGSGGRGGAAAPLRSARPLQMRRAARRALLPRATQICRAATADLPPTPPPTANP